MIGIGRKANSIKDRTQLAQADPSWEYILGPARGKQAPIRERTTAFPARHEAAKLPYAAAR
jgi:hypothetical protein